MTIQTESQKKSAIPEQNTMTTQKIRYNGQEIEFETLSPLKNSAGEVLMGDSRPRIVVSVNAEMKKKGIKKIDSIDEFKVDPVHGEVLLGFANGNGKLILKLEGKPELKALWDNYSAITNDYHAAREQANQMARDKQDAVDGPLLQAMYAKAKILEKQIPAGGIQVEVVRTGDADGWPIYSYRAGGVDLSWQDVEIVGNASAIRPGALSAFENLVVAFTTQKKIDTATAKTEKKAKDAKDYKIELATKEIPECAVAAYNKWGGNEEKAWGNGDETDWALINIWKSYIETQKGIHFAEAGRVFREMANNELTQEDILAEKEDVLIEKIADILLDVEKFRTATDDPLVWLVDDPLCGKAMARLKALKIINQYQSGFLLDNIYEVKSLEIYGSHAVPDFIKRFLGEMK